MDPDGSQRTRQLMGAGQRPSDRAGSPQTRTYVGHPPTQEVPSPTAANAQQTLISGGCPPHQGQDSTQRPAARAAWFGCVGSADVGRAPATCPKIG